MQSIFHRIIIIKLTDNMIRQKQRSESEEEGEGVRGEEVGSSSHITTCKVASDTSKC